MMSAAALLGALAKMTVSGFRNNWRMASMIVTVLPVPGLRCFSVRNLRSCGSKKSVLTVQRQ